MSENKARAVVELSDVWFEPARSGSRLRIATTRPNMPKEVNVVTEEAGILRFKFIADIKELRVLESTEQCLERVSSQSPPFPLLQLSGPFQKASPTTS